MLFRSMEGSDYEDKCSQRADDVGRMNNREKGKISPRKEKIGVNCNIVLILLFGVDVPVSSEGIRLSSEVSRMEANDKIELGEEL